MKWLGDAAAQFFESWDGAAVAIYVGCFVIFLLVWRVLDAEKSIEKRLDALEKVASRHCGENPGNRAEHPPRHGGDDLMACHERLGTRADSLASADDPADGNAGCGGDEAPPVG